jgi:hypothetical protein
MGPDLPFSSHRFDCFFVPDKVWSTEMMLSNIGLEWQEMAIMKSLEILIHFSSGYR